MRGSTKHKERGLPSKLSREELSSFLSEETLFAGLGDRIAHLARQTVLAKGSRLFTIGQPCESLHFVVSGTASLVKTSTEGRQRVLHRAISGEMVGAVPFFDGRGYPVTFVAETDCLVASLPRDQLLALLAKDPQLTLLILGGVVTRLRTMTSLVEQLSFEDTTTRLWKFLVRDSYSVCDHEKEFPRVIERLPTREQMADSIGTVREVVSRRLSALAASGHVQIVGRTLTLLKPLC